MDNKGKRSLMQIASFQDSIFVGACSCALLIYSLYHHYFDKNTSEWKTSPFLFPTLISVFGILLTLSLVTDAVHELRSGDIAEKTGNGKNPVGVLVVIAASLAYYFLMPKLHFIPATGIFLAGLFVYLGERKWWKVILLSAVTTAAVYFLFGVALHVRLP